MPCRNSGSTRLCAIIVSNNLPRTETPCHLRMLRSYLRLWPTFSMLSSSNNGRNSSSTAAASLVIGRHRDVISRVLGKRKSDAEQPRLLDIKAGGFGVEAK